jgi:hypothetical protein
MHGKLEKDSAAITFGRPVLAGVTSNPLDKSGRVAFSLDEADERSAGAYDSCS